ncbi:DUF3616 domain-containing protein [Mesorhizobium sp. B2-4-4]|uniref:DUF3616 domain-containing protein n=1 Tax=Mesorhizobium sp. B2-4-4 TaxID=2589945 RepID=UPI0015E35C8B|nr:DUF3616 domain-containing protein [Mesorhizobium sp. B2-4-4]
MRIYRANVPGNTVGEPLDLDAVLNPKPEREIDLEASAWLGDDIYWIGSHSRNNEGKQRKDRWRLFATRLKPDGSLSLSSSASVDDILKAVSKANPALRSAILLNADKVGDLAPDKGGFNIEGMAAAKDGSGLLIGLRSPLLGLRFGDKPTQWNAVLFTVSLTEGGPGAENALGKSAFKIGPIHLLDLGGRGVRSMDYASALDAYFIVAGPVGGNEPFAIYRWSGADEDTPVLLPKATETLARFDRFTAEAMILAPEGDRALLLSDDGDICNKNAPTFRGAVVELR